MNVYKSSAKRKYLNRIIVTLFIYRADSGILRCEPEENGRRDVDSGAIVVCGHYRW